MPIVSFVSFIDGDGGVETDGESENDGALDELTDLWLQWIISLFEFQWETLTITYDLYILGN